MNILKTLFQVTALVLVLLQKTALAGPYNFSDIVLGDRAMGLGGAFGAIADDSSALYYNPAGLAFAVSSSVSASVNALQITRRDYKNLLNDKDSFLEKSQDIVPTFTGGVMDLTRYSETLHAAFNLQTLTQQSNNQNDFLRRPDIAVEYFHRSAKSQTSEALFGVGAGKQILPNLALGFSVGGRQLVQDQQIYQDVSNSISPEKVKLKDSVAATKSLFSTLTRNDRFSGSIFSAEVGAGLIWAPKPTLSVGLTVHFDTFLNQKRNQESDSIALFHYQDYSLPTAADFEALSGTDPDTAEKSINIYTNKTVRRLSSDNSPRQLKSGVAPGFLEESFGIEPGRTRVRLGFAYFPSARFLLATDLVWHRSQTEWLPTRHLTTNDVLNIHVGSEYFFSPSFFLRQGFFTNGDARPKELKSGRFPERIDFYGTSLFLGTQSSETQFSGGVIYQYGIGEALKIEGQVAPKPVREDKLLLAFTATHGL